MNRRFGHRAKTLAIGALAGVVAGLGAYGAADRLFDDARARAETAAAQHLAATMGRVEIAGGLAAPRIAAGDWNIEDAFASAKRVLEREGRNPELGARVLAAAMFARADQAGAPHQVLDVVGGRMAEAAAGAFAGADEGARFSQAATRAMGEAPLAAAALAPASNAENAWLRAWLVWPLKDGSEAFGLLFEAAPLTSRVLTTGMRSAESDSGAFGADVRFGDKRVFVRLRADRAGTWPLWLAAGAGLIAMLGAIALRLAFGADHAAPNRGDEGIARDIERKQRELDASEARFRHLAESTNVTPWTADLDARRFTYIGPQIEDLTGFPASQWVVPGFWADHIHPGDRQRVLFEEIPKVPFDHYHTIEYRVRAADGAVLNVRNMLTVVRETETVDGREVQRTLAQGFLLDVTELKLAADALQLAREKAEDANRVKSEFLANMSHELRTPLNAVIGFSEIMKDQLFGPLDPQYREYATSIHTSGRHLLDLINDVLDLSKIEAGRFEIAEEETDLGAVLKECAVLLQERMQSAGLHGRHEIPEDLPSMLIDERRIKQVILNLLSNAIKFTPPGGSVTLSAAVKDEGVVVSVRDTGIGMSAEEIPRALAKFGQIDGDLSRAHDGTGLGLPIAKSLIEMHGGRLEVRSDKGKGTEMRIWLPTNRIVSVAA